MANQSLGFVTVTTAGTPVQVTVNPAFARAYLVQTKAGNTGKIWIGDCTLNKTTGAGVFAVIPIPTANIQAAFVSSVESGMDAFNMAALYLDADVGGETALVSYVEENQRGRNQWMLPRG